MVSALEILSTLGLARSLPRSERRRVLGPMVRRMFADREWGPVMQRELALIAARPGVARFKDTPSGKEFWQAIREAMPDTSVN